MSQQPGEYGTAGEQYGQQFGQQGPQAGQFGQGSRQPGQGSPQFGGQQGPPGGQQGGGMDIKLEEGLTDEMRVVLHDLVQSATACEWCAERCIDEGPAMSECLRLCRDVADLATLNVQFLARDSVFGPEAIEVFASAAEACAQECARHGHSHCQECAEVLSRAVQSTRNMLASFGQGGGQMQGGQMQRGPMQGGQMGPQGGQMESPGGAFGQPQGQQYSEAPGQQSRLPISGGSQFEGQQPGGQQPASQQYQSQGQGFQQPQGQSFGQPQGSQQGGQPYSSGQSY